MLIIKINYMDWRKMWMSNKIEELDSKSKARWIGRAEFQRKKDFSLWLYLDLTSNQQISI